MSSLPDRAARIVTEYRRFVIVALLIVTLVLGTGASAVEQSSSLEQFQSDTPEGEALSYAEANFSTGAENVTSVQVIVRGENVLDRESLLQQLRFQQELRTTDGVRATLVERRPTAGVANLIATTAIRQEQAATLEAQAAALQADVRQVNRTAQTLTGLLDEGRALQRSYDQLNSSLADGTIDQTTYEDRAAAIKSNLSTLKTTATSSITEISALGQADAQEFHGLVDRVRSLQRQLDALNASRAAGNITAAEYTQQAEQIQAALADTYAGVQDVLQPAYTAIQDRREALRAEQQAFQNATRTGQPVPLADQIDKLESMNASAVETVVGRVLQADGSSMGAFGFMPTSTYETGSTQATSTLIVVRQFSEMSTAGGTAPDRLVDSQLQIKSLAESDFGADDALVFGAGIITDEINRSMNDSLAIVGPLALLFVLVVLIIAYRDLLDIVLGLTGIFLVLIWTFGFMGWAGFAFNQLFVAIPVLLIGLSIDYAIHVFMRHREERARGDGDSVGHSMKTSLASVGVALTFVTATTVIGFLSNLISSVPPIREFGIVSAVGIVAALFIFGMLVPALKVEIDGFLEGRGWDRQKRAFGTGGGRLSGILEVGSTAARKAPVIVVLLTVAISAAGVYGATQVDTTFDQADFIADDPPEWTDQLPEPFRPGDYDVKQSLTFVNENFARENSQAQLVIRGDVTDPALLDRLATASDRAAESEVTVTLSNQEADLQSPLTAIDSVAQRNESVAALVNASDTDNDGRPDENITAIYDAVYAADSTIAGNVLYRTEDGYEAARLVVAVRGNANGDLVTSEMRAIAGSVEGSGVSVVATGQPIVFDLVSEELLSTVIESLLITLVAIFLFLMITYRITDGSATLGIVTLLPVAFSVSWILGTMYLLGIPFNVLTGLITSLTVGLGVAYSIHISERYSYELERADTAWSAMETALAGTGGALLGSAATTVGGFGVLAFAILPPLRQFGIITGLTIIYAFLGSVLVLPTFLALWTRYVGPGIEDDDEGSGGVPTRDSPPEDNGEQGKPQLLMNGPGPTREIDHDYLEPGTEYSATVTFEGGPGRVLLRESLVGTAVTVTSASPEPIDVVIDDSMVYAAWGLDEECELELTYTATVPPETPDGQDLVLSGVLRRPGGEIPVSGDDEITVVSDVFERILAQGDVTAGDLRTAGNALRDGQLSREQFERVYNEWLRQRRAADTDEGD